MNYKFGDRLIVELISAEIFEGEFVSGSGTRIDLNNVTEYNTGNPLTGLITFYQCEISLIRELNKSKESQVSNSADTENLIKLTKCEYERLKNMSENFIYISSVDSQYYNACECLSNSENIGLVSVGSEVGRLETLNLLVASNWSQVYIFDIYLFNKRGIPQELRCILGNSDIKKVIHDSRSLVDCLEHCYNIKLGNIFDTQVADHMLGNKKIRNIGECLVEYFNFPATLLQRALTMDLSKWKERPMTASKKMYAAQLAAYLIVLKNHLENLLLKSFYEEVEKFSQSTLNYSSFEAQLSLKNYDLEKTLNGIKLKSAPSSSTSEN